VTADPNFPRAAGAAQAGLRGACAVPVRLGPDALGVLEFFSRNPRPPDDDLQRALSALAGQVGQFLERKRREARDEEQARLAAFGRDVGLALNRGDPIPDMLHRCAEAMVQHLHGAFARVWTLNEAEGVLELQASAGMYTHTDGPRARVPLGQYEIGRIAQERRPHRTNAVVGDPLFSLDQEWARSEGLVAFAGYPLLVEDRVVGVMALFARRPLSDTTLDAMASVANAIALGVERKRAEEALREADRRKDEFLAMLAHELRNPLAPISNALHVVRLRGDDRDDGVREAWEIMERQVEHMVRLVDDLLDVGRITRGKITLQKQPVDVATVVSRAVEGSRPLIDARRHRLEVVLPAGPLRVEGDPTRLAQVVWNLLNNSAKYTPEGGRITLAAERGRGEVALRVRDTGMGIPAEALPTIFDLFTQAERTLDRAEGGLGIGLTLVRRLTELHGGAVEAHSEGPGRGSEFVVRLPLLPEEAPAAAAAPRDGRRDRPPPRRRVLVVDDNTDSAASLTMLLRLIGHEAHAAHDGRAALGAVEAYRPELVLLDIGLPVLDGYEVARNIRAEAKYDGVVLAALTGYGGEEDRRRSQVSGFDHHLVKPVDLRALQALLASLESPPARQPAR
jgi:signal transduction histidine kinase/ActR/RegA family two-component response regulator